MRLEGARGVADTPIGWEAGRLRPRRTPASRPVARARSGPERRRNAPSVHQGGTRGRAGGERSAGLVGPAGAGSGRPPAAGSRAARRREQLPVPGRLPVGRRHVRAPGRGQQHPQRLVDVGAGGARRHAERARGRSLQPLPLGLRSRPVDRPQRPPLLARMEPHRARRGSLVGRGARPLPRRPRRAPRARHGTDRDAVPLHAAEVDGREGRLGEPRDREGDGALRREGHGSAGAARALVDHAHPAACAPGPRRSRCSATCCARTCGRTTRSTRAGPTPW